MATKLYTDEVRHEVDSLSPENKLIFSAGPLVGTGAVYGAFCCVVSNSPDTGILNCGRTRGHFGAEMKFSGFDAIVIEGKSEYPVYVAIIDDHISIQPVASRWSMGMASRF